MPADARTNTYYVKLVKEVVPLGVAVAVSALGVVQTIRRTATSKRAS